MVMMPLFRSSEIEVFSSSLVRASTTSPAQIEEAIRYELFDATYSGALRHGIAVASKTGWVYLLNRVTGKPFKPRVFFAASKP